MTRGDRGIERQLELVQPKFICTLGSSAAQNLLATTESVGRLRGSGDAMRGKPSWTSGASALARLVGSAPIIELRVAPGACQPKRRAGGRADRLA